MDEEKILVQSQITTLKLFILFNVIIKIITGFWTITLNFGLNENFHGHVKKYAPKSVS